MSDTPSPNTVNEKTDQEPSRNLEISLEQSSAPKPNPEPAQNSDVPNQDPETKTTNTLAILCLIFGLVGAIPLTPGFINIIAIIMGHIGRSQIRQNLNESGAGIALAGLILSYVSWLTIPIIFLVVASINLVDLFRMLFFGGGYIILDSLKNVA